MPRQKTLYRETYQGGGLKLSKESLPTLNHNGGRENRRFIAKDAYITAAGVVEENGVKREYQDIRIYVELAK